MAQVHLDKTYQCTAVKVDLAPGQCPVQWRHRTDDQQHTWSLVYREGGYRGCFLASESTTFTAKLCFFTVTNQHLFLVWFELSKIGKLCPQLENLVFTYPVLPCGVFFYWKHSTSAINFNPKDQLKPEINDRSLRYQPTGAENLIFRAWKVSHYPDYIHQNIYSFFGGWGGVS